MGIERLIFKNGSFRAPRSILYQNLSFLFFNIAPSFCSPYSCGSMLSMNVSYFLYNGCMFTTRVLRISMPRIELEGIIYWEGTIGSGASWNCMKLLLNLGDPEVNWNLWERWKWWKGRAINKWSLIDTMKEQWNYESPWLENWREPFTNLILFWNQWRMVMMMDGWRCDILSSQ